MCYLETFENVIGSVKGNLVEIKNTLITDFKLNDFIPFETNGKFFVVIIDLKYIFIQEFDDLLLCLIYIH